MQRLGQITSEPYGRCSAPARRRGAPMAARDAVRLPGPGGRSGLRGSPAGSQQWPPVPSAGLAADWMRRRYPGREARAPAGQPHPNSSCVQHMVESPPPPPPYPTAGPTARFSPGQQTATLTHGRGGGEVMARDSGPGQLQLGSGSGRVRQQTGGCNGREHQGSLHPSDNPHQ